MVLVALFALRAVPCIFYCNACSVPLAHIRFEPVSISPPAGPAASAPLLLRRPRRYKSREGSSSGLEHAACPDGVISFVAGRRATKSYDIPTRLSLLESLHARDLIRVTTHAFYDALRSFFRFTSRSLWPPRASPHGLRMRRYGSGARGRVQCPAC